MTYPLFSYSMVGQLVTPPYQTVNWLVYGAADTTGAQSGYFGQLQNISVASQQQITAPDNPDLVNANAISDTPVRAMLPSAGQVLVATVQPDTTIQYQPTTVPGFVPFAQANAPLSNGLNSNIPTTGAQVLRVTNVTGPFSMGGFTPPAAGTYPGLTITNPTAFAGTIVNADSASTPTWRINTQSSGTAVTMLPKNGTAILFYDFTASTWTLQNIGVERPTHYHVDDYGADPTGTSGSETATTTAINTAIALASASGTNATVLFGSGTYLTTGISLSTSSNNGITLRGAGTNGSSKTVLKLMAAAPWLLGLQGKQINVQDIWLHGNNLATVGVFSPQYLSVLSKFENLIISNANIAIPLPGTYQVTHNSVGVIPNTPGLTVAVSGASAGAPNGIGGNLVRLAVSSTAQFTTGQTLYAMNVGGVPNANGASIVTVIDINHVDLQGTIFAGTYTSGGILSIFELGQGICFPDGFQYYVITSLAPEGFNIGTVYQGATSAAAAATAPASVVDIPGHIEVDSSVFAGCQISQEPVLVNPGAGPWFARAAVHTTNLNASNLLFHNCYLQTAYYGVFARGAGISLSYSSIYDCAAAEYAFEYASYSSTLDHVYTEGGSFPFLQELASTGFALNIAGAVVNVLTVKNCTMLTAGGAQQTVQVRCNQPVVIENSYNLGDYGINPDAGTGIYPLTLRGCTTQYNPTLKRMAGQPVGTAPWMVHIDACKMPCVPINRNAGSTVPITQAVNSVNTYSQPYGTYLNVQAFGAVGDAQEVGDAVMNATSFNLQSSSATFTSADLEKLVVVDAAATSGFRYTGHISAIVDTHNVTMDTAAGSNVTGKRCTWGTDNDSSIQCAFQILQPLQAALYAAGTPLPLYFPAGKYMMVNDLARAPYYDLIFDEGAQLVIANLPSSYVNVIGTIKSGPFQILSNPSYPAANGGSLNTLLAPQPQACAEWLGSNTGFFANAGALFGQNTAAPIPFTYKGVRYRTEASGTQSIALTTGSNDNVVLPPVDTVYFSYTGNISFTGIAPLSGTSVPEGQEYVLVFPSAHTITIGHQRTSTSGNQITSPTGADLSLAAPSGSARFIMTVRYSGETSSWEITNATRYS